MDVPNIQKNPKTSKNIQKRCKRDPKKIRKTSEKHPKNIQTKNYPKNIQKHPKNIQKISEKHPKTMRFSMDVCIPFCILVNTYVPWYIIIVYFEILCGLEICSLGEIAHNNDI